MNDKPISDKERARRQRFAQLGTLGGQATYRKYGSAYMSAIGRQGFDKFVRESCEGNRAKGIACLKKITHPDRNVRQPRALNRG